MTHVRLGLLRLTDAAPVVLAHAEDQLMSAELTKTMVEEMIALYKRIDALEEALEQKKQ